MPSILKVDSACSSQTVQVVVTRVSPRGDVPFLDVLQPLLEEPDDVLVVEGVEDHAAVAARPDEPHAAQQAQLVGDGGFAQPEEPAMSQTQSSVRDERVEDPHARGVAETLKVSASVDDRRLVERAGAFS